MFPLIADMPSEKRRYMKSFPANEALRNSSLPEKARTAFARMRPESFNSFADSFTNFDSANIYFLITNFVKLNAAEMRLVLEMAKDSDDIIREDVENKLWLWMNLSWNDQSGLREPASL